MKGYTIGGVGGGDREPDWTDAFFDFGSQKHGNEQQYHCLYWLPGQVVARAGTTSKASVCLYQLVEEE